ncbi:MAG: T9SS type A sorting domain-containing protein [Bacteroidota bacterium]
MLLSLLTALLLSIPMAHGQQAGQGHTHSHEGSGTAKCGFDHLNDHLKATKPGFAEWYKDYIKKELPRMQEAYAQQQSQGAQRGVNTLYIPVVFHIIHNAGEQPGEGQNLSDQQIMETMDRLNEDFAALNPSFNETPDRFKSSVGNPDIQFCLAAFDPDGNPTTGIERHVYTITGTGTSNNSYENQIKDEVNWDPFRYMNVYTGTIPSPGVGGYAYLPSPSIIGSSTDGIVMNYLSTRGSSSTLTHEVGHYLGLPHTFNGDSCGADDGISDTPNQRENTNDVTNINCSQGFPIGPMTCGSDEHMFINYMDYTSESCVTSFSNGQIAIMRSVLSDAPVNPTGGSYGSRLAMANSVRTACLFFDNDAGVTDIYTPAFSNCADLDILTPEVRLVNFGFDFLTTVKIHYQINGGTPVTMNYTTNLPPGGVENVTLQSFVTPAAGTHEIRVYTTEPNGVPDEQVDNDTTSWIFIVADKTPFDNALFEDFTSGIDKTEPLANLPSGMVSYNEDGDEFGWEWNAISTPDLNLQGSIRFKNYVDPQDRQGRRNKLDYFVSPNYDFTNITGGKINFDLAYAQWINQAMDPSSVRGDSLFVMVSTDCGATFDNIAFSGGGTDIATSGPTNAAFLPVTTAQWRNIEVDLSAYSGLPNVSIAIVNKSGQGNYLYIDNVNITHDNSCFLGLAPIFAVGKCASECDASASVFVISGGTAPYTYQWPVDAGSQTTARAEDLCPGTYNVTVTDALGCSRISTALILTNPPIVPEIEVTNASCGTADGGIKVTATGGSQRFTFFLLPRIRQNDSLEVNNLSAGTYDVVIRDFIHLCTDTIQVEVINDSDTELEASSVPVDCFGNDTGSATVEASGTSTSYSYLWDDVNAQETATATGLAIGTYTVIVTDDSNCSSTTTVEVTGPPELILTPSSTPSGCAGSAGGTASVQVSGGTVIDSYGYLWDDPLEQTTPTATGLAAGTYNVTVTDDQDCSKTIEVVVEGAEAIELLESFTPVSCNGLADGTASVQASGGTVTGDYRYLWNDPNAQTGSTATALAAGRYTVIVTDDNDCSSSISVDVIQPTALEVSAVSTDPACFGEASGTATAEAAGGTVMVDYSYLWSDNDAQQTAMATGLVAGTYTVTVTDDNQCSEIRSVQISQPDELLVDISGTNVACFGEMTGSATVEISGGTVSNNYDIVWDDQDGQTTATATGLAAGTYNVTVTDDNNCSKVESIDIGELPDLTLDVIARQNVGCFGDATGSIEVLADGGDNSFTYTWSDDADRRTALATGLVAGFYIITVADGNACEEIVEVEITEPDGLDVTVTATDVTVVGGMDGSATADVTGGTRPLTYLWPGGQSTRSVTDLEAGTYCVTVTDANNCTEVSCATVNDVNCPTIEVSEDVVDVSCAGSLDGEATVTPSGGEAPYSYRWNDGDNQSLATATGLGAGTYTVTVADNNNCEVIYEVTVSEPDPIMIATSTTNETVVGANDGTATATASGGTPPFDYDWGMPGQTPTVTGLMPGTYVVTVTDANDCEEEISVTILPGSVDCSTLTVEMESSSVSCFGDSDGTATAIPSGGTPAYSYLWDDPDMQETATATGLAAGTYRVTVTDANDCTVVGEVTVDEPLEVTVEVTATNETSAGLNDGTATAVGSGGVAPYSYQWSPSGVTASITDLAPGLYVVTVTDANDCTAVGEVEVLSGSIDCNTLEVELSGVPTSCNGGMDGSATASPTGGTAPYEYLWNDSDAQTTQTATGLAAGTYRVTVEDANGCETSGEITIDEPALLVVAVSSTNETALGANDGTASAIANGGTTPYSYQWSNGQNGITITDLEPGEYCVTVSDGNACSAEACVTINPFECETPSIEFNTTDVSCFGGDDGTATTLVIGSSGPYTFSWDNGQMMQTANMLTAGPHEVTVTDARGCVTVAEVTIEEPTALELALSSTNETTIGGNDGTATATPSGGTPPYSYEWSPSGGSMAMATGLAPGVYVVLVTDAEGCTIEGEVEIEQGQIDCSSLTVEVEAVDVLCNGDENGTATANPSGGSPDYTYEWSDGQMRQTAIGLRAGTYRVTVTDDNGCTAEEEVVINQPAELTASTIVTNESFAGANDGTATAVAMGGTAPYSYDWGAQGQTQMITGLSAGMYTVTITDENGCTVVAGAVVEPGQVDCSTFSIEVTGEDVSCFGDEDGTASVITQNGTFPFTYEWSNGMSDGTIFNLPPATYQVTVIDANNCRQLGEVTIGEPDPLTVTASKTDETVDGANDGTATASPSGGTSPYNYSWSDANNSSTQTIENLPPGVYVVTVTDANDCTAVTEVEVEQGEFDCSNFSVDVVILNARCFGSEDGSITLDPQNEVAPLRVEWNDGNNDLVRNGLAAGTYTVTLTDAQNCQLIDEITISQPDPIQIVINAQDETIVGQNDGSAEALASGGTTPYLYRWSNNRSTQEITDLPPGTYSVTVTDANGCTAEAETEIQLGAPDCSGLQISLSMEPVTCPGGNDGSATVEVTGNQGAVSIEWDNNGSTSTINGLEAGDYSVQVTDAAGCTVTGVIKVEEPLPIFISINNTDGKCGSLGSARANATGGTAPYTYEWSTGESGSFVRGLDEGTYQVTVTDGNGCEATESVEIEVEDGGLTVSASIMDVSCFGESDGVVVLDISEGTAPFTINWNTGESTQSLDGVPAGVYSVQIEDAAGCTYVSAFNVRQPEAINVGFQATPPTSGQGNNGSLVANVTGGVTPYTYLWNTGSDDLRITNLGEGTYVVSVTDGNGCVKVDSFELTILTVGLEDIQELNRFEMFPNPTNARTNIMLEFSEPLAFRLEIYDLLGRRVYTHAEKSRLLQKEIILDNYAAGTYIVRIRTERGQAVKKLLLLD